MTSASFNPTLVFTVLALTIFVTPAFGCVTDGDFCLVRPSTNAGEICNEFRQKVVLPACVRDTTQTITFAKIATLLRDSEYADNFFDTCNCECSTDSAGTYSEDVESCFLRSFRFGAGACPTDVSLKCSDVRKTLCPPFRFQYTGGNLNGC